MPHADRITGEFEYIEWVRQHLKADPRVPIGIGDDTAAIRVTPGREVLVTTDMIVEGVHFDLQVATVREVGRKALAVNLSDIAAMAGIPLAAVAAVALPQRFTRSDAEDLFWGISELASEFQVAIVGGDTNRARDSLVISITVLGETTARGAVRRSTARPGDRVLVTGSLGGSIHGKHLTFCPRVREATVLHERYPIHAMIDISDGLASDLGHIISESRCGAVLNAEAIPVSAAVAQGPPSMRLDHALHDGEDFELLFTMPEPDARRLIADQPLDVPVCEIGVITEPGRYILQWRDGTQQVVERRGYDHFKR